MIKGIYFDGETSSKKEVSLFYDHQGRIGIQGAHLKPVALNMLTISPRIGNTPRYIEFPQGGQFETEDNDAIDAMLGELTAVKSGGFIYRIESAHRIILLMVVFVAMFAWGFVQYGVPYFSRELAMMLPADASRYLGQGVLETMDEHWFEPSQIDADRQSKLQDKFAELINNLEYTNDTQLVFRHGKQTGANAFALPDGTIVITDELVELASSDQEVASVMLHEVGHLYYRHSVQSAIQQFGLAMFIMVVTGDVSTSSSVITALPAVLIKAGYSQNMEWEADGFALDYMKRQNIETEYFASMMEKLEASHSTVFKTCMNDNGVIADCLDKALKNKQHDENTIGLGGYLSSHPLSSERIARFRSN